MRQNVALRLAPAIFLHCAALLVPIGVASFSLLRVAAFWLGFVVGPGVGLYTWFEVVRKAGAEIWPALMQKAWIESGSISSRPAMQTSGGKQMRNDPLVPGLMVLVTGVLVLIVCSCAGTSTAVSPELEEFAAQAIIDEQLSQAAHGYQSPEGAIVAHVADTEPEGGSFSPKRVWRYSGGQLTDEDPEELHKALGGDRSEWPSFTFVFSFESATSRRAIIDVHTYYDMGIMADSRGGNAQRWQLEKKSGAWIVTKKVPYMFWD